MSNVLKMLSRGGAAAAETDPNFKQTVLLLHGDGTNGAQNNTFLDSSTNNFTITRNGNTTQGTFSPFSLAAGEWSNYFDGSGDYLTVADNAAFTVGSGNWTLEAWVYPTASPNQPIIFGQWSGSTDGSIAMMLSNDANRYLRGLVYSGGFVDRVSNSSLQLNAWNHCAFVREGTYLNLYLNGVRVDNYNWGSSSIQDSSLVVSIGASSSGSQPFQGNISNARFVKGTAIYSGATYTVPTAPLTAITNTSLLTCQSNRFVDNSTNAFAITRNGDVRVTPFSPFAPTAAYSAGTNGGSGYFDGSGDYLTAAASADFDLGGGDFTVEGWFYVLSTTANPHFFQFSTSGTNRWNVYRNTNFYIFSAISGVNTTSDTGDAVPLNQWFHLAVVKSSTTTKIYLDGVEIYSDSRSYPTGNMLLSIGFQDRGGLSADYLTGWVSSFRVVKGTAVYTAAFTPPTAPLTAIANTELLLNFTNAGIFDNTGKNNLETVGNAQIDTTTKKYGTGSMEFDGTGDYLLIPNNPNLILSGGVYTIEGWIYPNGNYSDYRTIVAKRVAGANTTAWQVFLNITNGYLGFYNGTVYLSSTTPTANQWSHFAAVFDGTNMNLYLNGTSVLQTAITNSDVTANIFVGWSGTIVEFFNGFIDDLRITKGVARYTANFTPPIKELPDL